MSVFIAWLQLPMYHSMYNLSVWVLSFSSTSRPMPAYPHFKIVTRFIQFFSSFLWTWPRQCNLCTHFVVGFSSHYYLSISSSKIEQTPCHAVFNTFHHLDGYHLWQPTFHNQKSSCCSHETYSSLRWKKRKLFFIFRGRIFTLNHLHPLPISWSLLFNLYLSYKTVCTFCLY